MFDAFVLVAHNHCGEACGYTIHRGGPDGVVVAEKWSCESIETTPEVVGSTSTSWMMRTLAKSVGFADPDLASLNAGFMWSR